MKKWKNKSIIGLDDDLSKYSIEELNRIDNGNNAVKNGQLRDAAIKGGIIMGNQHLKNGTGLFGMSEKKKKKAQIDGGKIAGQLAVEKGTVSKAGKISVKSPNHVNNRTQQCSHCKKIGGYTIMKRWHMDNCKYKK